MCVNVENRTFGPVHTPKKANISLQFAFQEFDDFPHEFLPVAITTPDGKLLANDARYYFAIRRYVMVDITLPRVALAVVKQHFTLQILGCLQLVSYLSYLHF